MTLLKTKTKKTQHCICGFNFYITWNGNVGHDQHGHEWTNPKKPKCSNEEVVNICLDTYN